MEDILYTEIFCSDTNVLVMKYIVDVFLNVFLMQGIIKKKKKRKQKIAICKQNKVITSLWHTTNEEKS